MIPLSVLDLCPIIEGGDARRALANSLDLARHAEALGYHRFWLAEHHNMPGIASAATAVVMGHVAAGTSTIRVGAGGVMLPNHAPLIIAEQFGTLESLHPGRIDLGVGRAPGTDQLTAQALRRTLAGGADTFPQDVLELRHYFAPPAPSQSIRAVPGAGLDVPIWILGSSLYGAQLAAGLGLPYAFASHFAPAQMIQAIDVYRRTFRPSEQLDQPYVMLGVNAFVADTDEEAALLATSVQQAFVNLRRGAAGPLRPPVPGYAQTLSAEDRAMLAQALSCTVMGRPAVVRDGLRDLVERTGADELIVTAQVYDHDSRKRSYALLAQVRDDLDQTASAA